MSALQADAQPAVDRLEAQAPKTFLARCYPPCYVPTNRTPTVCKVLELASKAQNNNESRLPKISLGSLSRYTLHEPPGPPKTGNVIPQVLC